MDEEAVIEGAESAASNGPAEATKRLRRAVHLADEGSAATPQPKPKPKAKAKSRARSTGNEPNFPGIHALRENLQACLKECKECGQLHSKKKHDHRDLPPLSEFVQFSMYWSRCAVGVKTRKSIADKWVQVAYFCRPSPCIFTNVLLACRWVAP